MANLCRFVPERPIVTNFGRLVKKCPLVAILGRSVLEHPLLAGLGRLVWECPKEAIQEHICLCVISNTEAVRGDEKMETCVINVTESIYKVKIDLRGPKQPQRLYSDELKEEQFLKATKISLICFPPWRNG